MMWIPELQRDLQLRLLDIWQGSSGLSPDREQEYRDHWLREAEAQIIAGTEGRSLLDETRLRNLIRCVRATMHLPGPMLEVGTFKGGSAWVVSQADPRRRLYCCDTWTGHPLDEEGGHKKCDFAADLEDVRAFLEPCNVTLISGEFPQSEAGQVGSQISLAHLDCDYLTPEMVRYVWDRLAVGGILVVDDYEQGDCPTVKDAVDSLGVGMHLENRQAILFKDPTLPVPNVVRKSGKIELLIEQRLSPGDMLGGVVPLVESIHKQFPGEYLTDVAGTAADVFFAYSPHRTRLRSPDRRFYAHYNVNGSDQRSFSFAQAHCDHFSEVMKLKKPLINQTRKPSIYLTEQEREPIAELPAHYLVMTAGYKTDCDVKGKGSHLLWADVVEYCRSVGVEVLQVGERNSAHVHDPIPGAVDLVGRTSLRQLVRLVSQAVATLSSISLLTHVSAAFDVPNLCVSSRESHDFAMYRTTIPFHCIGLLSCASGEAAGGCWRNTLEPVLVNGKPRGDHCALPVIQEDGSMVPTCTNVVRQSGAVQAQLRKIFLARGIL